MSKLFDDASLAMIPSAYKDGKLYSIRPTDGSGDFTFSRGSNLAATRVDVNGLIEKGRENLLLQSNQFDTTWAQVGSFNVVGNQQGYDSSNDAWSIESNSTAFDRRIQQSVSVSGVHTFAIYAKSNSTDWVLLYNGTDRVYFDLANGVVGSSQSGLIIDSKIEPTPVTGWYRCTATFNRAISFISVVPASGDGNSNVVSGNSIYIQDAQLEQGLVATDYIETGTSAAQSGILEDMPRLDYSGGASCPALLLEPQRSNLFTQSEYFNSVAWTKTAINVTDNAVTSPEGISNAAKLVETTANSVHQINQVHTISGNDYSFSVFVKKAERRYVSLVYSDYARYLSQYTFDLEDGVLTDTFDYGGVISTFVSEDYGNGWYRLTLSSSYASWSGAIIPRFYIENTATPSQPPANNYAGDGTSGIYIYGATLETGSYPTSYIPTYGTSQTRSLDSCVATLVSDVIGQTQGTMFIEIDENNTQDNRLFAITNGLTGNNTNYFIIQREGSNALQVRYFKDGGSEQTLTTISGFSKGSHKIAFGYKNGDFNVCIDGTSNLVTSTITMPVNFNTIVFSKHPLYSSVYYNAVIKQALIFPTRLTDAEMVALTS